MCVLYVLLTNSAGAIFVFARHGIRDSVQDYSRSHPEARPGWDRIRQVTHDKKREKKKVSRDPRIE